MKEFDLEKAKAGAPICTRDGKVARLICWDRKGDYPIIVIVNDDGEELVYTYTANGRYCDYDTEDPRDLMMVVLEHDGWINLYASTDHFISDGVIHNTEEHAKENLVFGRYVKSIKIHWEE